MCLYFSVVTCHAVVHPAVLVSHNGYESFPHNAVLRQFLIYKHVLGLNPLQPLLITSPHKPLFAN